MQFNEDLAAIHGYLCADGYVTTNKNPGHKYYHVGFRNTNKVLLNDFEKRIIRQFNLKPSDYGDGRKLVRSKELFAYLTDGFSYYSRGWVVPELSKSLLRLWLRAYFDCDGWVYSYKRQDRRIGLDSVNLQGLTQIKRALEGKFDIKTTEIKKRKGRDLFELFIYGKNNLEQFREEINFLHPEKRKKLIKAISSFINYQWDFPQKKGEARKYVKILMRKKARANPGGNRQVPRARAVSIKRENLVSLKRSLAKFYEIESKVFGPITNGYGTQYYELSIHKKKAVEKLLRNNLLSKEQRDRLCQRD